MGDFGREYTTLFKAASLIIDTIPKHKDFQLPRYQKQYKSAQDYLRKTVMPRLEKIKAGKMAQAVHAPVRAHAVKVDTGNMPSVNWQQYQPAASVGQQHVPANYFVRNPTVDSTIDRRSHQPPPVTVDPADPFSASVAFSSSAAPPPTVSLPPATVAGASHNLLVQTALSQSSSFVCVCSHHPRLCGAKASRQRCRWCGSATRLAGDLVNTAQIEQPLQARAASRGAGSPAAACRGAATVPIHRSACAGAGAGRAQAAAQHSPPTPGPRAAGHLPL